MGKDVEWRKMDEYYWIGPPGWTICRVIVGGKDAFELWQTTEPAKMVAGGLPSLKAAQKCYAEVAG